jgi:hypothetical protein
MENFELTQQQKFFNATGLHEGDAVVNYRTGQRGWLYISAVGYACVRFSRLREGVMAVIWNDEFERDEYRPTSRARRGNCL